MSEICNNCGHAKNEHGRPSAIGYLPCNVGFASHMDQCTCTSFTARPDEPKCGICLSSPAEADGCCPECREASEPALLKWQNHEDGQTIARLTADLQAERTRRIEAEKVIDEAICDLNESDDPSVVRVWNAAMDYRALDKYPAQASSPGQGMSLGEAQEIFKPLTNVLREEPECAGCRANRDGDCDWKDCPQLRAGEPMKSGRHCPLDINSDEERS